MDFNLLNIALTFGAGFASVLSPCVLPVIPIIVTGSDKDSKYRPLFIVAGLSLTFILMGILSSLTGSLITGKMHYIEKIAGGIIVIFGIMMLLDINIFKKMTFFTKIGNRSGGKINGFFLGFTLGIIWIPCVGPLLSSVLALVAKDGNLMNGAFLLLIYSLGFSIPMLLAGYSSQVFRSKIRNLGKHTELVRYISGGLLVVFGIYIISKGVLSFSL